MATLIGSLTVVLTAVMALSSTAVAWNIPGHMLSATIAYQILLQENPKTIDKVKAVLEKHPWYANQWQASFKTFPLLTATWCCSCRRPGGSEPLDTITPSGK